MSRVVGAFVYRLAALSAALWIAAAAQAQELFPRPAALEPAVRFWTRVYTEITTDQGFIHDSLHLDIVYATVEASSDWSPRERRRRIERSLANYRTILTKLGGGARDHLSAEEQRVRGLFPAGTSSVELRAAAERLRFQLGQADRFRAGLVRSGRWKPYIHQVLDAAGLPRELAALPHVESSFDPTAYSKVGAAGMWQFTRSTGVRYMQIDQVIDERRDPFLATHAAARLLADNHGVLQSWPLALTAYNHGLAGMRRAAAQQRTTDIDVIVAKYQSRSFGFASRNFYTAFLAALEIDGNHEKYFGKIALDPPSPTEVVQVPAYVTAEALAKALDVRQSALRELNPALTDAVWAGDKYVPKGFPLRLPTATAALAENLLSGIGAAERYAAQRPDLQHRVRRGDTLSQIAAEYGVSLAALMRVNGLSSRDLIRVGQMISLPQTAGTAAAAVAVLAATEPPAAPAAQLASGSPDTYVVRRGDSVARIASRLGVAIEDLLAANSIGDRNLIYPGQTLRLPGAASEAQPTETATVGAPEIVAAALPSPGGEPGGETEAGLELTAPPSADEPAVEDGIVAEADALPEDAVTGLEAVTEVNALAAEQAALAADPSDYSVSGDTIVVQALETLGHYADWLGLPTQRLRDLNGLSFREAVVIGQRLKIDLMNVDTASFEQRRVAYQQAQQGAFFARYHIEGIENHVIKSGESLWLLAGRTYKVPVWLLRQYNPDLDLDRVPAGTIVKFPKLRAVPDSPSEPAPTLADSAV